jgi:hypothetical protein
MEDGGIVTNSSTMIYANDYKKLQKAIAEYMDKSISFYDAEFKKDGIRDIFKFEIAFSGKTVSVKTK